MTRISVSIDVSNLKQAETFYVDALGCKKVRDHDQGMSVLAAQNCDIYLQEKQPGTKPTPSSEVVRDYKRHWTPVHLDFLTPDIDSVVEKILKFGGRHEGGESGDWGSIAFCADPFGNGFCVINE